MGANLDYSEGFSGQGTNDLIEEIKAIVISGAGKKAIDDVKMVTDVCDQYWDGEAKERFKKNLEEDAKLFCSRVSKLANALQAELVNTAQSYKKFDDNLIQ